MILPSCTKFRSWLVAIFALAFTQVLPAGATPYVARHGLTSAQYQAAFDHYVAQGFRLRAVDGYATPLGMRYAGIWEKRGGGAWIARHGLGATAYQNAFDQLTAQGFRPRDISVSALGAGSGTFAALWEKAPGRWVARHGLTSAQYQAAFNKFVAQGFRLSDVEGYTTQGGVVRYAAVWEKRGGGAWVARHGLS
ncbi:MAG: serine hydrolase, partial [Alphaproteobacteria bacterium]